MTVLPKERRVGYGNVPVKGRYIPEDMPIKALTQVQKLVVLSECTRKARRKRKRGAKSIRKRKAAAVRNTRT